MKTLKQFLKEQQELTEASLSSADQEARAAAFRFHKNNDALDKSGLRVGGLTTKDHPIHAAVNKLMKARDTLMDTDITHKKYPERHKAYKDAEAEVVAHGHELLNSEKGKNNKKKPFPYGV